MAIKRYVSDKIVGLSSDSKPINVADGATFYETNTKFIFLKVSGSWVRLGAEAFPIGSVFVSVVSTDPATLLGYGTWARIAEGRMLIGQKATDADFDTAEETGGAKTHTLTVDEMPAHDHTVDVGFSAGAGTVPFVTYTPASTVTTSSKGGGGAHSIMNPFFVVYAWKRTA